MRGLCCATLLLAIGCGDDTPVDEADAAVDQADAAQQLTAWERALEFVGGEQALGGLVGYEIEASGTRYVAYESPLPTDPAAEVSTFDATTSYDLASDNLRIDYARTVGFLGGLPLNYSEVFNGNLGYIEGIDSLFQTGNGAMLSARWASGRKQHMLLNPHVLLARVLADSSIATETGEMTYDGATYQTFEIEDAVYPITLWVVPDDGRIAMATTMINEFLTRDSEMRVTFDDWQAQGDLMFPNEVAFWLDEHNIHTETRTAIAVNPAFGADTFTIPPGLDPAPMYVPEDAVWGEQTHQFFQQFASIGITLDYQQTFVQGTELVPGIWYLTGGSHNSLAIEQENGIVIVEAPNAPERGDAILAWATAQFPNKPVTHVIGTHHHEDHAAGQRAFVAAGATVVVHEAAETFMGEVFAAPSTVVPDALAMNPMEPTIQPVASGGMYLLDDAIHPVYAYDLSNGHASDMLLIYVPIPNGGIAFESDLYNPGNGGQALNPLFAQQLYDAIQTVGGGLEVTMIAGGHGTVAPLSELEDYLAAIQP